MSALEIEESFTTSASPAEVMAFLLDPEKLVGCLPGAELEAVESERSFRGRVRVVVGTVTLSYQGRGELTEVDEGAGSFRAEAEGREKGGAGKVRLHLAGHIGPDGDGSRVAVTARVALAGKIVRFGRGLIEAASKDLFQEFANAVRERVEATPAAGTTLEQSPPAIRALPLLLRALWGWLRGLFAARR